MSIPDFPDCPSCGKGKKPSASVATHPGPMMQIPCFGNPNLPCDSNAGKFYDVFQSSFVVPIAGTQIEVQVCDASLWSECQWIGVCYANAANLMAIFKVVSVDEGTNKITIYNGCKDGTAISDNPAPGTSIPKGSVFYPLPPPQCATELCEKIRQIISEEDCACQGVLDCLAASKDVCFTSVKDLQENEEVHLFGGTRPTEGGDNFFQSCLRKLKRIFTSFAGTTLCFPDAPSFDPEETYKYVFLDENNCLRAGATYIGSDCSTENDVEDNQINQLSGCQDGQEATIRPSDSNKVLSSCKDENNNKFWKEKSLGLSFFPLHTGVFYPANGGPRQIDDMDLDKVPPVFCGKQRWASFVIECTAQSASSNYSQYWVSINGVYAGGAAASSQIINIERFQCMVPVDDDNPNIFNVTKVVNGGMLNNNVNICLLGIWG